MKTQKPSVLGCVVLLVVLVGLILAIVGITQDYLTLKVSVLGATKTTPLALADLKDADEYAVINAFSILTIVAAALALCVGAATALLSISPLKFVAVCVGVLAIVFGIVAIAQTASLTDSASIWGASAEVSLAAGPILILIGGILSGLGAACLGVLKALKKA